MQIVPWVTEDTEEDDQDVKSSLRLESFALPEGGQNF